MVRIFIAIMVSSILVLITAGVMFMALPRDATTAEAPVISTGRGQQRREPLAD